jgi:hypothetical protein
MGDINLLGREYWGDQLSAGLPFAYCVISVYLVSCCGGNMFADMFDFSFS